MSGETILVIYLFAFTVYFVCESFLIYLQKINLKKDLDLPFEVKSQFDSETLLKSEQYSDAKLSLSLVSHIYSSLFLVIVIFTGLLVWIYDWLWQEQQSFPYLISLVYIFIISFIFQISNLPLQYYSIFVIEEKFGFNRLTIKQWILDNLKSTSLGLLVSAPILFGIIWFVEVFPNYWWLLAFCLVVALQLSLLFIYPTWIAPLFNKFEKLPEGELRENIFDLSTKLKFNLDEVYVMDGSRRSSHGNAYFTGFGKNQRVVLFDTLINDLTPQQIIAVLAHEIGHKKLNHILKQVVLQFGFMFVIFALLGFLYSLPAFYQAFGFFEQNPAVAMILFSIVSTPFLYFLTPISSILQRKFEYQADQFAKEALGDYRPLADALVRLYQKNLGNLKPHPFYSFFHYSHPTLVERLAKLKTT